MDPLDDVQLPSSSPSTSYACPWPGCLRTYKKIDHLNRHRRTHSKPSGYTCSFCSKKYSRSDVLARHLAQVHRQKTPRVGRPRKTSCAPSAREDEFEDDGHIGERHLNYLNRDEPSSPRQSRLSQERDVSVSLVETTGDRSHMSTIRSAPDWMASSFTSVPDVAPAAEYSFWASEQLIQNIDQDQLDPFENFYPADSVSAQEPYFFDWELGGIQSYPFDPVGIHLPNANLSGKDSSSKPLAIENEASEALKALKAEEVDGQPYVADLPNGSPGETTWPDVRDIRKPNEHVSLPSIRDGTPKGFVVRGNSVPGVNAQARASMQTLTRFAHRNLWSLPDLDGFPSSEVLTACINLYLANFSPWLPIVDSPRGSFRIDKAAPILLLAIAAVGAVYGNDSLNSLVSPLGELVRRQVLYTCEYDYLLAFQRPVVQASLLQSYLGLYSGSPSLIQKAEISRASLVTASRRMHLLRATFSATEELSRRTPNPTTEDKIRARKQDHRDVRLGWAIFLFDAQLACFFGSPALFPMTEIHAPLPTPAYDSPNAKIPFDKVMAAILTQGQLPEEPSDMGFSCIAYALYRLSLDDRYLPQVPTSPAGFGENDLDINRYPKHPQKLLDELGHYVLTTPSSINSLRLSCIVLAHHSHLQFARVGWLEQIHLAAGKAGDSSIRQRARIYLSTCFRDDPPAARKLFAHAAILHCLLTRFTFDSPTEVVWTFDSALCMWAFLRFSGHSFTDHTPNSEANNGVPTSLSSAATNLAWNYSLIQDQNPWIDHGRGRLSIQGIGTGKAVSIPIVLKKAIAQLDIMSWGLASKYQRRLEILLSENEI